MKRIQPRRSIAPALACLLCSLAIGACGDAAESTGDSQSADAQEAALDFAQCMRENGVDVPDPEPGQAGVSIPVHSDIDVESPTFKAAEEECRPFLEDAIAASDIERPTEIPEEALEFARCMREQGIDFPDPELENGMIRIGPDDPAAGLDDAAFRAATQECEGHLALEAPAP